MVEICPHCGHCSLEEDPRFCSACGGRIDNKNPSSCYGRELLHNDKKSPQFAGFCSSLIPGLGQVYNGETVKGFVFLLGTLLGLLLLLIPGLVVWIYSMYEAYNTAGKMNEGTLQFRPLQMAHMVLFVVAAIFIVIVVVVSVVLIIISNMLSLLGPAGNTDFYQMLRISNLL